VFQVPPKLWNYVFLKGRVEGFWEFQRVKVSFGKLFLNDEGSFSAESEGSREIRVTATRTKVFRPEGSYVISNQPCCLSVLSGPNTDNMKSVSSFDERLFM